MFVRLRVRCWRCATVTDARRMLCTCHVCVCQVEGALLAVSYRDGLQAHAL